MREENISHPQQFKVRTATMPTQLQGSDLSHRGARALLLVLLIGTVLFVSFIWLGCAAKPKEGEAIPVVGVQVTAAERSDLQEKITIDSVIYPIQQAAIVTRVSAPVAKFYVGRGSHVHAGDLLAELENRDLKAAYDQAEANYLTATKSSLPQELDKAQLDLNAAKETYDAQQKAFESRQALYKQGAISRKDLEDATVNYTQAKNAYELAKKHFDSLKSFGAEQELKLAEAQLAAAKASLSYSEIRSPIDGVVTDRPNYAGEMPATGSPLITVMDLSRVIAKAHVAQQAARSIKVGSPATITVPGGGETVDGKVSLVSPALDPGSTTVEVWVEAANPGYKLKPGTSANVSIINQTVSQAVVVPAAAVITNPDGTATVMLVGVDNKPRSKAVKLGIKDGEKVQITEGLEGGETVVTVGAFELAKEDPDVLAKTTVTVQAPKEED
jgi:HlyD family secretion protein